MTGYSDTTKAESFMAYKTLLKSTSVHMAFPCVTIGSPWYSPLPSQQSNSTHLENISKMQISSNYK